MATVTVTLRDGLTVGDTTHRDAELREATTGDLIDATSDSEQLRRDDQGEYHLVPSPTLLGLHVLRRQVLRVGEHKGPLSPRELRLLSTYDLNVLQGAALQLEAASLGGARAGESSSGGVGAAS